MTAAIAASEPIYGGSANGTDQMGDCTRPNAPVASSIIANMGTTWLGKSVAELPARQRTEAQTEHKSRYHDGDRLYVDTEAFE